MALFDDVAHADEFEVLYQIQALTNPRLQNELGRPELIARDEIPFGIPGCAYATAPFTHLNPAGSWFSAGHFDVLYLAKTMETAPAEVRYHQNNYGSKVHGLNDERLVLRGLSCHFTEAAMKDAARLPLTDPIYDPDDYSHSHALGSAIKADQCPGLRYWSVRHAAYHCWALMTPRLVLSIVQTAHDEMIWNGKVTHVNQVTDA